MSNIDDIHAGDEWLIRKKLKDVADLQVVCQKHLGRVQYLINKQVHTASHSLALIRASNECRNAKEHVTECINAIKIFKEHGHERDSGDKGV